MFAFWLLALIVFMMIALFSLRIGLIVYLIGALVFPSLWIGEVAIRIELVYCLWLLFVLFLRKSSSLSLYRWHSILSRYGLFLLVTILSTLLTLSSAVSKSSLAELLVPFYGLLRPLFVMFLFLNASLDERFVRRILQAFLLISIPIALLSLGQILGISVAQEITLAGYTSPSRSPVFRLVEEHGSILRAPGVFESPVYNAIYLLIMVITSVYLLIKYKHPLRNRFFLYIVLGVSAMAGIVTLSASFLVGAAIVLFLFIILQVHYPQRSLRFTISSFIIVGTLLLIVLPKLLENPIVAGSLHYQVERILGGNIIQSRYDPGTGSLASTYEAVLERPILGWGLVQTEEVFVGDSFYVSVLYLGGGVGLAFMLFTVWSILRHSWRFRKTEGALGDISWLAFLYTLLLIALAIGAPGFWTLRLQEWYWAIVGIGLNPSLRVKPVVEARGRDA